MNDYRWIASLAILVSFVAETASGQQASTFLEHERTTDGRASYVVSVVTGLHANAVFVHARSVSQPGCALVARAGVDF